MTLIADGFRYLLMAIALDAHTGDPIGSPHMIRAESYPTIEACGAEMLKRGPIKAKDGVAIMLYCERVTST